MTITNKNQNQARSCNAMWKMRINAYDGPDDKGDKERKGVCNFWNKKMKKMAGLDSGSGNQSRMQSGMMSK